jgi:ATP-dependent Clp protease ATP-binding subunit ClpA
VSTTWGLHLRALLCVVTACLCVNLLTADENYNGKYNPNNNDPVPKDRSLVPTEGQYRYIELVKGVIEGKTAGEIAENAAKLSKVPYYDSAYVLLTKLLNEHVNLKSKSFGNTEYNMITELLDRSIKMLSSRSEEKVELSEEKEYELEHQRRAFLEMIEVTISELMEKQVTAPYYNASLAKLMRMKSLAENMQIPFQYSPEELRLELEKAVDVLPMYSEKSVEEARAKISSSFYREQGLKGGQERIKQIREFLNKNVIEQPEAIEALIEIEMDKYLFAKREAPEVVVFMGLPGTGKDTIAEAYIKSLHPGDERAVEKHMYRFQILRSRADQWSELGSGTGYKGSDQFPAFLDFIVEHSGGRYYRPEKSNGEKEPKILENENWKGVKLPGTKGPEDAVVFLNEFHDWAMISKNEFAKEFLEKGIVTVNNPNGGLKKLYFPTNIIVASNDGIDLIADRHLDGRPRGRAQQYDELMRNWEGVYRNRRLLKSTFMKTRPGMDQGEERKGTSEEVVSRLQRMILLRPLSPEGLQRIANIHMNKMKKKFAEINENVGKIALSWKESILIFVQEYLFDAEESARPIKDKVKTMIEGTVKKAIMDGHITSDRKAVELELDVKENKNGTSNLEMEVRYDGGTRTYSALMERTKEVEYNKPISEDQVKHIIELEDRINERVFGVENIAKKLAKAILNAKIRSNENEVRSKAKGYPAQVFSFFGLSSTGKTELTKVLGEELTGRKNAVWEVDCNGLQSEHKWQEFFGFDFSDPNERSEFQKEYDRRQGKMIVVLDELANVRDKNLLKNLYAYFREAEVGERSMKNVTFVITGNAGEEWYRGVPKDLPELLRHFSMLEIYKKSIANVGAQEQLLMEYFPEALLKRIGMERIFFFSPMNFENIRRLTQLKLKSLFDKIYSPNKENHWWDVYFKNKKQAERILNMMEREGFTLDGQGDSIRRFIEENFAAELNEFLLRNKVKVGEKVELSLNENLVEQFAKDRVNEYGEHGKGLYITVKAGEVEGEIFVQGKPEGHHPQHTKAAKIFTAYHEAGHEIVREVFLGDMEVTRGISIIPGVTEIGMKWIVYAGIAKSEETQRVRYNEETFLRRMAILFGGEVAETLTSKGGKHGEGKSNDIERATQMARAAILEWGLSERFGRHAKQPDQTYSEYIATLSEEKKRIYEEELDRYLKKARELAVEAILSNWKTFVDMGKSLAEIGDMSGVEVYKVYERNKNDFKSEHGQTREEYIKRALHIRNGNYYRLETGEVAFENVMAYKATDKVSRFWRKLTRADKNTYETRDAELLHEDLEPKSLKRIEDILEQEMKEAKAKVDLSGLRTEPVGNKSKSISCKAVFPSSN